MNKYLVEFLGTLFLVFVIFATGNYLAIGAALAVAAFLGGPISGGAFNPAVAISLFAAGKLSKADLIPPNHSRPGMISLAAELSGPIRGI